MPNAPRIPPNALRTVEILAVAPVQLLDVAGPLQAFSTACELAGDCGTLPYTVRVVSPGGPAVTSSAGLGLLAHPLPPPGEPVDTLLVAGGPGARGSPDPALLDWLRARATATRRLASVCTGAFLLGAAGLLDGRRAVTHWRWCGELAARFPDASIESDPIFVRDGPVWTSAGVTAGIDLSLALIEEDLGRPAALEVARHLVVFLKRPGGQAQFSAVLGLQCAEGRFDALHRWVCDNLDGDLSAAALSARAGMSERSFLRHYRTATGTTPARAVERLRVEAARQLLGDTSLSVKRIAARCGFGSEETMRRSFLRLVAVSPQEYRARFPASVTPSRLDPFVPGGSKLDAIRRGASP